MLCTGIKVKSKVFRLRNLIAISLISIFIWWASYAVIKYWSQPLTTDISYNFGDFDNKIQFPLITFCQYFNFPGEHPLMKNCDNGSWNFLQSFPNCLKIHENLPVDTYVKNLQTELKQIIEMTQFWDGKYINLQHLDDQLWSTVFHHLYGPCHTFDLSKSEMFKFVPYKGGLRPGIQFILTDTNPWHKPVMILHTKYDLPDAYLMNDIIELSFTNKTYEAHKIKVRKMAGIRETTRKFPCVQYEHVTCQSIEDNTLILEKFHCSIPILYSGKHLDNLISTDTPNCSKSVTEEALDLLTHKKSNCIIRRTCGKTRFKSTYKVQESWVENKTLVYVTFQNPEVTCYHTYISYDLLSLIGEVGGTLGLTLGASAISLFESLFQQIAFY